MTTEVEFSIKGQPGTISATTFRKTVVDAIDLLQEYDSAISGIRSGSLSWYLSKLYASGEPLWRKGPECLIV